MPGEGSGLTTTNHFGVMTMTQHSDHRRDPSVSFLFDATGLTGNLWYNELHDQKDSGSHRVNGRTRWLRARRVLCFIACSSF